MVKFAEINSKMDSFELEFTTAMQKITDQFTGDIVAKALAAKNIADFTVEFPADYRKTILATIKSAYNYAKTGAADELKVNAPATSKEATDGMQELATFIVDKQQDDLKNLIKSELLKINRTRNLAEGDEEETVDAPQEAPEPKDALSVLLGAWFVDKLAKTGSSIVSQAVNYGRNDVFEDVAEDGDLFQFSSILDDRTCKICRPLDGKVVERQEYKRTGWKPPIHFHCRCLWILIRKVSKDYKLPDVTGIPTESGGYFAPLI
jgi:SPP1 gp7 family putative phage head morphogenesis protein